MKSNEKLSNKYIIFKPFNNKLTEFILFFGNINII